MLPFMAAAAVYNSNKDRTYGRDKMMLRKFNLCYALLRENPTVVASGITENEDRELTHQKACPMEK